jgi:hypothetical protein
LFHSLKSHAPGDSEWDDLVAFLQEFCSLAKHLQMQHRQNLWNKMTQLGMFEVRLAGVLGGSHQLECAVVPLLGHRLQVALVAQRKCFVLRLQAVPAGEAFLRLQVDPAQVLRCDVSP